MHPSKQILAALFVLCSPALAEEPSPGLSIELNAQASTDAGCLLTFMVNNSYPQEIESAVFETVLFNKDSQVDRLTLFDFGNLPADRPRVRQFQVDGLACDDLGQVLINGASICKVGGEDSQLCSALDLNTRIGTELIG